MRRTTTKNTRTNARKNTTKVLASVVLVAGAASVAGLGTFGSFTDTTSASENVSNGRIDIDLTQGDKAVLVEATGLVPGDTAQRAVTLTRGSKEGASEKFGTVSLSTVGSQSNALTSDTTNGLKLSVDQCSVPWVTAADNSLTCSGTTTSVLASSPVIGTNRSLPVATTALNGADKVSYLRLQLVLPTAADNTFQGLTNGIGFTFDATQRANENR